VDLGAVVERELELVQLSNRGERHLRLSEEHLRERGLLDRLAQDARA
jgi:hypothetical protein